MLIKKKYVLFVALLVCLSGYVYINYILKYVNFDQWMDYYFYKYENKLVGAIIVFQENSKVTTICNYNDYLYYELVTGGEYKIFNAKVSSPEIKEIVGEDLFNLIDDAGIICAVKHKHIIELDIGGGHDSIFGFASILDNNIISDSLAYDIFKNEFSGTTRTESLRIKRINKNWLWYYYTE